MTQDEIIRMAREAGLERCDCEPRCHVHCGGVADLERFATLVAAHEREKHSSPSWETVDDAIAAEREACVKIGDEVVLVNGKSDEFQRGWAVAIKDYQDFIRARGEK